MKPANYCTLIQVNHLGDYQLPEQKQVEQINDPIPPDEKALRSQFELEDKLYQRLKLPLHDAFFDLCSK